LTFLLPAYERPERIPQLAETQAQSN